MAGEIQTAYATGRTLYAQIRNEIGQIWNGTAFSAFSSANWLLYTIAMLEDGSSCVYLGNIPTSIQYQTLSLVVFERSGATPTQGDLPVAEGTIEWDGYIAPSSQLVSTSRFYVQNLLAGNPLVTRVPDPVDPTSASVAGWWTVWSASDPADPSTLTKSVGDGRIFGFDFGNLDELSDGQTITYAAITISAGGVVAGPAEMASAYQVVALFSGGTVNNTCEVTCSIELSGGTTIVRTGLLAVAQGGD
jgi:hypothetical protein